MTPHWNTKTRPEYHEDFPDYKVTVHYIEFSGEKDPLKLFLELTDHDGFIVIKGPGVYKQTNASLEDAKKEGVELLRKTVEQMQRTVDRFNETYPEPKIKTMNHYVTKNRFPKLVLGSDGKFHNPKNLRLPKQATDPLNPALEAKVYATIKEAEQQAEEFRKQHPQYEYGTLSVSANHDIFTMLRGT